MPVHLKLSPGASSIPVHAIPRARLCCSHFASVCRTRPPSCTVCACAHRNASLPCRLPLPAGLLAAWPRTSTSSFPSSHHACTHRPSPMPLHRITSLSFQLRLPLPHPAELVSAWPRTSSSSPSFPSSSPSLPTSRRALSCRLPGQGRTAPLLSPLIIAPLPARTHSRRALCRRLPGQGRQGLPALRRGALRGPRGTAGSTRRG